MTAAELLAESETLCAEGHHHEAIARLTAADRAEPDARIERELVKLRHLAFAGEPVAPATGDATEWIPAATDPGPFTDIGPAELSLETLRDGIARHGCVLVRGLLDPATVAELVSGIDHAFDACDAALAGAPVNETAPWFARFTPGEGHEQLARRGFVRASGGVWAIDSPRMLMLLLDLVDRLGIGDLAEQFLGERPALSANKCNLRRVPPGECGGWHQDGAFLGRDTRSLNLWIALSDCGTTAPTLDIIPRRFDELVETGTVGTYFDWAVAPDMAEQAAGDAGILRPQFRAGDAMLFDHMFLHRTARTPEMPNHRYAIESWFFAPSSYPPDQIPFAY